MSEPVSLPKLLTIEQVAEALEVSTYTVMREIKRGHLIGTRRGRRKLSVREDHYLAYLDRGRTEPCEENETTAQANSGTTGSPSGPTRQCGAGPGSTPPLDRRGAHRLAKRISKKQS